MTDVVLDLETFGVGADSAVVSVGAFCLDTSEEFGGVIDAPSGTVEVGAVRWWLTQREEVRKAVSSGLPERAILVAFAGWLSAMRVEGEPLRVWGSEDFDTVILGRAYDRNGIERPWHYQEPRGLRTVFDLAGVDEDAIPWGDGIEHRAGDCARHAATALHQALAILSERTAVTPQPIPSSVSGEGEGSVTEA